MKAPRLVAVLALILVIPVSNTVAEERNAVVKDGPAVVLPRAAPAAPEAAVRPASTNGEAQLQSEIMDNYAKMAASFSGEEAEKKDLFFYSCRHMTADTLRRILEGFLSPGGTVAACDESGVVVVSDAVDRIETLRRIAESVDVPIPQAVVEARIVELTLDSDFEKEISIAAEKVLAESTETSEEVARSIGAALTTPGANPNTGHGALLDYKQLPGANGKALTVFLRYLETRGKARILSAPSLVLRQGSEGSIITGEEVPILTQTVTAGSISTSTGFKSVGVKLRVVPVVIGKDLLRVEISPEVSTVTGFRGAGSGIENPIIAVRNATTELAVKSGQLVSIGGLLREEERKVERRVPILSSIPLLGHLFRSTRRQTVQTQLVIFLTLTALDGAEQVNAQTITPGAIPEEVRAAVERMKKGVNTSASRQEAPGKDR